jgi:DNA-binding Lrp family transcriptional regulator
MTATVTARKADEVLRLWREALAERVRKLARAGHLTGLLIENARRADLVLLVDFYAQRFDVLVVPRWMIVECIPPDNDDRMLEEMAQGQPALEPAEASATWCFVTDKTQPDKPSTHMRLRGLRVASQGNA